MKSNGICQVAASVAAVLVGLQVCTAPAANIVVTNASLRALTPQESRAYVRFDVSWDASWRASWLETGVTPNLTVTNWDAAWVFVKYRCRDGANTSWRHASLSTNNSDHVAPAGSTINVGLSPNATAARILGVGAFLYRSAEGAGSWTNKGVELLWRYTDDGVTETDRVDVSVHAIEMVHVPQGSFWVGDGATSGIAGQFEDGTNGTPFLVTNDNYSITLGGGSPGSLGNNNAAGMAMADDFSDTVTKTLPAAFPKGFNTFYCMKYKISQGQYADFLNQLTSTQASNRCPPHYGSQRFTIRNLPPYSADAPTRTCNFLSWDDGPAYADWAGLRLMTELEYEKGCRGPLYPVTGEYAWGNTNIVGITGFTVTYGVDGSGLETALPATANCNYSSPGGYIFGPVRCGIYATAGSNRERAGASYWGIMGLSGGDVWGAVISAGGGYYYGGAYTGAHGDGKLTNAGKADVAALSWPDYSGYGRGGPCAGAATQLRVSDRSYVMYLEPSRGYVKGWQLVRTAPAVNP